MILSALLPIPAPDPVPQPAPGWLLWGLLVFTFLLHLIAMNLVLGGSLIGAVTSWRARRGSLSHHRRLVDWLTHAMPIAVAATINFGVAPLLFLQVLYGRLFFSSSVLLGWFWFAVVPLVMVAYYGTYLLAFKGERLGAWEGAVRWLTIAIFLSIAFIFTSNMSLMLRPDVFRELYAAGGAQFNSGDPTLLPRFLHLALASIAVAGMWVAGYGLYSVRRDPEFGTWAMRYGASWFSATTAVNVLFGFWFLFALPRTTTARFMGEVPVASALLGLGMFFGLGSMAVMFMAAHAPRPTPLVRLGMGGLVLTLVCMVLMRDQVRRGALATMAYEPVTWVEPQWGNISVFLVLLVIGALVVIWMVRALAAGAVDRPKA
jgi:hypothetical protein